jgi:hypothetical protein
MILINKKVKFLVFLHLDSILLSFLLSLIYPRFPSKDLKEGHAAAANRMLGLPHVFLDAYFYKIAKVYLCTYLKIRNTSTL